MVNVLDGGQSFAAHGPFRVGIRIAFDVCNHTLLDRHENTATAMAAFTRTPYNALFTHFSSIFRSL
jgi:hypothetical protein